MSGFDSKLQQARKKQRWLLISIAAGIAVLGGSVFAALLFTNGTSVQIHPDKAASTANIQVVKGFGLTIADAVYAMGDPPLIRVTADGFRPEERLVTFQEKGGKIDMTLRPLPGHLVVTTSPSGPETHWSINGQAMAISQDFDTKLDAGQYTVEASNPFYKPVSQTVNIVRAKETDLHLDLSPVQGTLHLVALPTEAQIRINDEPIQNGVVDLAKKGGAYRIEISHPDFITLHDTVEITNTEPNISRTYHLRRKTATLNFDLAPDMGHLLVDGTQVDPTTPAVVSSKVEHTITYLKAGYIAQTRSVTVLPDQAKELRFHLKPEIGKVVVTATPTAAVYVNGKIKGSTPLTLKLSAVPHQISLRKSGYRTVEKSVNPTAKTPVLVNVKLMTELAARLADAPKEYRNFDGITLKLFQPSKFVMGGRRSEIGQRANEFLRTVQLSKPFYAGVYEVTKSQYAHFKGGKVTLGAENEPVTSVRWEDAAAFCNWLSAKEGLMPFYNLQDGGSVTFNKTSDGYRLLTEAEWEWLARRVGRPKETVFPWGDKTVVPPKVGNIADENAKGTTDFFVPNYNDGYAKLAPVGTFQKEASGLYDITGNVSEWVNDYYSLVPPEPNVVEHDPLGPNDGDAHVIKGSSWRSGTRTTLRAAFREGLTSGRDDLGFRVGRFLYGGAKDVAQ